jgi:hypothetical protein
MQRVTAAPGGKLCHSHYHRCAHPGVADDRPMVIGSALLCDDLESSHLMRAYARSQVHCDAVMHYASLCLYFMQFKGFACTCVRTPGLLFRCFLGFMPLSEPTHTGSTVQRIDHVDSPLLSCGWISRPQSQLRLRLPHACDAIATVITIPHILPIAAIGSPSCPLGCDAGGMTVWDMMADAANAPASNDLSRISLANDRFWSLMALQDEELGHQPFALRSSRRNEASSNRCASCCLPGHATCLTTAS